MSESIPITSVGTSPIFTITAEEFLLRYFTRVSPVPGDWVPPPTLGAQSGPSRAMKFTNRFFPWIDEKLCPPVYDGVCQYFGVASNRPTPIRDYHMIAINRAVDGILGPTYEAVIQATVSSPAPVAPPTR